MTSVTYGMRKSLCKVRFDMYQGALANLNSMPIRWIIATYLRLPGVRGTLVVKALGY
jgi:hypothetical protein